MLEAVIPAATQSADTSPGMAMLVVWMILLGCSWSFGSWVERICAIGLGAPLMAVFGMEMAFGTSDPVHPSLLLLTGIDSLTLTFFMGIVFVADRRFTLFMAASALVGLVARGVALIGLTDAPVRFLTISQAGGWLMLVALAAGLGSQALRMRRMERKRLRDLAS